MKKLIGICMLAGAFLVAVPLSAQTPVKQDVKKETKEQVKQGKEEWKGKECPAKKEDCKHDKKNCPLDKKDVKEKKEKK